MTDLLTRAIGPKMSVETRFPLTLPRALVDENQLELALLNLVVNARDAMGGVGSIGVSARHTESNGKRFVILEVSDTGEGMDAETLERATEPFFTTKGIGKGTGLRLSMFQAIRRQASAK